MRIVLTLCLIFFVLHGSAQVDSAFVFDEAKLNQKDEKGRKHGFWKRYLTYELKPCKIEKAYFFGYELYDHGERVQKFYHQRFKKRSRFKSNISHLDIVEPILLDGRFEWHTKKGKILSREIYKNGRPYYITSYKFSRKDPEVLIFTENLYYNKLYGKKIGTFYYEEYTKGVLTFKGYFRKRDRGWRVYGDKKGNPKHKPGGRS